MSDILQVADPADLFEADGRLKQFLPLEKMGTEGNHIHFLTTPGIGDLAWVMAKFLPLKDRITFWFNNDQYKRQSQYADMLGLNYDFCDVDITRLYEAPGEFSEEEIEKGGFIGYLHPNHHIESGKHLKDWHPFLPMVNPAPFGRWKDTGQLPIAVHMAHSTYQEGNWLPKQWARALRTIEENFGPALVVGAFWDTKYAHHVFEHYRPRLEPMLDKPLGEVLQAIRGCRGMIGLDSGMCILARYMGVPTLQGYPEWLRTDRPSKRHPNGTHMPGNWEMDDHPKSKWTYVDRLLDQNEPDYFVNWLEKL